MRAQMAHEEVKSLKRMTASLCVADEVFRMCIREVFGDYRFILYDVKKTKDLKVKNPHEEDDVCGDPMWFVPDGWPVEMLVAHRGFEFKAKIFRLKKSDEFNIVSEVWLDLYNHEMRKGWEPMDLRFSFNPIGSEKVYKPKFKLDRRSTPTGLWIATVEEIPGSSGFYD